MNAEKALSLLGNKMTLLINFTLVEIKMQSVNIPIDRFDGE